MVLSRPGDDGSRVVICPSCGHEFSFCRSDVRCEAVLVGPDDGFYDIDFVDVVYCPSCKGSVEFV